MRSRGPPVSIASTERWLHPKLGWLTTIKYTDGYMEIRHRTGKILNRHRTPNQGDSPMAKKWPSQDVPQSGQALPAGMIQFRIEDLEPTESNSGKFMIKAAFRAVKPKEVKNMPHTEYFVIGSDDDPSADDPDTWKQTTGSKRFKTMLVRSQTKLVDDVSKQCKVAVGQEFLSSVIQETEEEGQYKGTVRARLRGFFEVGSRKPELEDAAEEEEEAKSKSKTKAKAAAKDDDDEDEEEDEPAPKKGAKSKKPAKDDDEDEEEEEEEEDEEEEDEDEEEEEEDDDDEDEKPAKKGAAKKRPTKKTTKK